MAIPSTPSNVYVVQGNQQTFIGADLASGATSYSIQRSIDAITYATIATPTTPYYLDTTVSINTQYWYQIASTNASGTSPYTAPLAVTPTATAELSLGQIRYMSQQKADRVNSNFVTKSEWINWINLALFELYDLLITQYNDYFMAPSASFVTNGTAILYPLPNGSNTFTDASGSTFTPSPFYKLLGVDLAVNTTNNGYVSVNKFNFINRNQFIYPNTNSTIYGVFNTRYRLMGTNIEFIPAPSAGQNIRLWYVPRLTMLLQDTDATTIGFSGWLQYVIVRAAKYALDKEESDTSKLDAELLFLKTRIEESAMNRDIGQPDTISDTRSINSWGMDGHGGGNGFDGGGW